MIQWQWLIVAVVLASGAGGLMGFVIATQVFLRNKKPRDR